MSSSEIKKLYSSEKIGAEVPDNLLLAESFTNTSNVSIQAEMDTSSGNEQNSSNSSVEVRVNGEEVPVAQDGVTDVTVPTEEGQLDVNFNIQGDDVSGSVRSSSSYSHSSSSSTDVRIRVRD